MATSFTHKAILALILPLLLIPVPHSQAASQYWAFQAPQKTPIPPVQQKTWPLNPVDHYILQKLENLQIPPSPPASRRDLIRRVSFDLLGLPPTPEAVESFVNDPSPLAYEHLVDSLLNNPHFGEKWALHWLDVIRYSESEGFEYDRHLPDAWRFRDYVIQSFNQDKPFDQFLREQLAGDELAPTNQDYLIAAGFHRFGPVRRNAGNPEIALSRNEVLTERTDIIGSALLGLTLGCARCHDHKFDPISQEDYYSIQAYLAASEEHNPIIASPQDQSRWEEQSKLLTQEIATLKSQARTAEGKERRDLNARIENLTRQLPPPLPALTSITNNTQNPTPVHLLKRGLWERKGKQVSMHPPSVLISHSQPEYPQNHPTPRTLLADWIVNPHNPLTARVIANRIWASYFGNGLVNTPNDFGKNGDTPSHPELLDYLALHLMENQWSLKSLHRLILLSQTYRQTSTFQHTDKTLTLDPENRLLWHFNRRRLQAEEIRDAMLSASGQINLTQFGKSIMLPVAPQLLQTLYKPDQWVVSDDLKDQHRRSIYLIAKRNLRLPFMENFDQPTLQNSCARRESSTHAPQALELLNGDISNSLAEAFSQRLLREAGPDPLQQIQLGWLLTTGRLPTPQETTLALEFLEDSPLHEFTLSLFNLNAFLYVL